MRLSVLMTVFREAEFVDYAIRSCLPYVDDLILVEGSYLETQKLGTPTRSDDGTIEIIEKYRNNPKVHILYANEQSDKDHRNVGLRKIKELNADSFCLIIDADEVHQPQTFPLIRSTMNLMRKSGKKMAYFHSLTFVNDLDHYTNQYFPRLFDLRGSQQFINDNYLSWKDPLKTEQVLYGQGSSLIKYHHYGFCKGLKKFEQKKKWWETRFGKSFDYGWKTDENGQITDKNHKIYVYSGKHPAIMNSHPMMQKGEIKNGNEK